MFAMSRSLAARGIVLGIVATLALASGAFAGQPVTQALNPEPPDTYTCAATGGGTICRAFTVESYEEQPGITCGSGANAFEVLDSGTRLVHATRWYDRDGNLTQRLRTFLFSGAELSNSVTGVAVGYAQHNTDNEILGVPGDLDSATWTGHGTFVVTAPGSGTVLVSAGVTRISPEGEVIFTAGPNKVDIDALCAALGTPNG